jgi:PST family polysaccharide transporter
MQKRAHILETGQVTHDLKGKSVRGGLYVLVATSVSHALVLGSIIVLARLLVPEDFGLVGMVMALTALAERFKHLGLSTATIQQRNITHEQVSALFWLNAGAGFFLTLLIGGLSQAIATFYQQPGLVSVTLVISLTFFFSGLSVQHEALLRRQMRFKALASIQIIANLVSMCIAIELALKGFAYWALVWKEVARTVFEVIGTWTACRWCPSFLISRSGAGSLLRMGRDIVSVDTICLASRSVDQMLLGKFVGAEALGYYKQAFQLMAAPMSLLTYSVGSVALPGLSALQDDPTRYERYYTKVLNLLSFVSIPLSAYLIIFSEDIIKIVLGEKWLESTGIFRILAIGALIEPLFLTCSTVMITQKKTTRLFWWAIMYATSLIVAFLIGVRWGAIGVATGYTLAHVVLMIPSLWIGFRDTPLSIKSFFQTISMPIYFSIVMATVLVLFAHNATSLDSPVRIGISLAIAVSSYLGIWIINPRGREHLLDTVSNLLSVFKPARSASA